ncbi:MAG: ATP-binding protein, partial [Thermoleophilaceae bacterium]|nr:ATP-binding protein [Thermoleophilaceae bacterium]
QLFRKLTAVDLLHLDDLGAEQQTEWVLEQLYSIVNERYEDGKAITITTNLLGQELSDQIGERTVSRLIEICGDPLPLFGSDKRVDPFDSPADEPTVKRAIAD